MSLNNPNPVRNTVLGPTCQAIAVLGYRIANGVAAKMFARFVRIASLSGWSTLWGIASNEAGRRASALCGLTGLELCVARTPNVHVSVRVTFQVSCA